MEIMQNKIPEVKNMKDNSFIELDENLYAEEIIEEDLTPSFEADFMREYLDS